MDIRNWCSSSTKRRSINLGSCHKESAKSSSTTIQALNNPYKQIWKVLWMKFKKEKKKLFKSLESTCSAPQRRRLVPYDPHSYSQNFDLSFAWDDDINFHDEQDDDSLISRSFSFRFADPSKHFLIEKH
ncbi:hypothetical protein CsatB_009234 [Cannabis sativa]